MSNLGFGEAKNNNSLRDGTRRTLRANQCEYCTGAIQPKKVTAEHWYEGTLVIIRDVPVGVCGTCGERYYEASTLEQLDAIARESESAQERMSVPVVTFALS